MKMYEFNEQITDTQRNCYIKMHYIPEGSNVNKWHKIIVEDFSLIMTITPFIQNGKFTQEFKEWCCDNIHTKWTCIIKTNSILSNEFPIRNNPPLTVLNVYFEDPSTAMLFKLTWT